MADNKYYNYEGKQSIGNVGLNTKVFDLIAKIAAEEQADISIDTSNRFSKGPITTELENNELYMQVEVNIKYGRNVNKTVKALQQKIAQAIYDMTEIKAKHIDVKIVGVDF